MGSTTTASPIPPIYGKLIVLTEQRDTTGDVTGYTVANNPGLPIVVAAPIPNSSLPQILQAPTGLLKFLTNFLAGVGWSGWAVHSVGNTKDVGPPPGFATGERVYEISVVLVPEDSGP